LLVAIVNFVKASPTQDSTIISIDLLIFRAKE
jgi:hypothetical protein